MALKKKLTRKSGSKKAPAAAAAKKTTKAPAKKATKRAKEGATRGAAVGWNDMPRAHVVRWMGYHGATAEDVQKAGRAHGLEFASTASINSWLAAGRSAKTGAEVKMPSPNDASMTKTFKKFCSGDGGSRSRKSAGASKSSKSSKRPAVKGKKKVVAKAAVRTSGEGKSMKKRTLKRKSAA